MIQRFYVSRLQEEEQNPREGLCQSRYYVTLESFIETIASLHLYLRVLTEGRGRGKLDLERM